MKRVVEGQYPKIQGPVPASCPAADRTSLRPLEGISPADDHFSSHQGATSNRQEPLSTHGHIAERVTLGFVVIGGSGRRADAVGNDAPELHLIDTVVAKIMRAVTVIPSIANGA